MDTMEPSSSSSSNPEPKRNPKAKQQQHQQARKERNRKAFTNQKDSFKQYVGNVSEGQGFADKRKKKAAYEYLKLLKKEKLTDVRGKVQQGHGPLRFLKDQNRSKGKGKASHVFSAAQKAAEAKKKEKQEKQEKFLKQQEEKAVAFEVYKKKKKSTHMKLCKRTHRGQPVMRHQMEVLLDKMQKEKGAS